VTGVVAATMAAVLRRIFLKSNIASKESNITLI
jgi:uncharacterized membrane protein (DUF373 family)